MSFIKEFKTFAMSGNIVDLAVAVIIGGAFGSIVSSLVDDIITPLLLTPALQAAHVNDITSLCWGAVKYGNFLSSIIKFTIMFQDFYGKTYQFLIHQRASCIFICSS